MDIRPGLNVRIVTEVDVTRERIHVKTSVVYDVQGQTAILAQADPPVLKSMLHKDIIVTYLVKENDVTVRYGFPARIMEFIDYSLGSGQQVKALKVDGIGEVRPHNIRMFYRVAPTGQSDLSMTICGTPVNVLGISLGGAKVSHDKSLKLQTDAVVNASIGMNGRAYSLEARILRTWDGSSEGFRHDLWFASMEFVNMGTTVEHALSQKIHDIERESLHKGMLP